MARANGRIDDPTIRQRLARQWSKVQIMRINGLRTLTADAARHEGPASPRSAPTNKMFWSETHRDTMELAMDVLGMDGQILTGTADEDEFVPGYGRAAGPAPTTRCRTLQASFFFCRSETIWGGTAEIQRNIVGERVLGLPKEPKLEVTGRRHPRPDRRRELARQAAFEPYGRPPSSCGSPAQDLKQRLILAVGVVTTLCLSPPAPSAPGTGRFVRFTRYDVDLPPAAGEPENFLIVGSDSRDNVDPTTSTSPTSSTTSSTAGQRTDTIIVLRIDPDRRVRRPGVVPP